MKQEGIVIEQTLMTPGGEGVLMFTNRIRRRYIWTMLVISVLFNCFLLLLLYLFLEEGRESPTPVSESAQVRDSQSRAFEAENKLQQIEAQWDKVNQQLKRTGFGTSVEALAKCSEPFPTLQQVACGEKGLRPAHLSRHWWFGEWEIWQAVEIFHTEYVDSPTGKSGPGPSSGQALKVIRYAEEQQKQLAQQLGRKPLSSLADQLSQTKLDKKVVQEVYEEAKQRLAAAAAEADAAEAVFLEQFECFASPDRPAVEQLFKLQAMSDLSPAGSLPKGASRSFGWARANYIEHRVAHIKRDGPIAALAKEVLDSGRLLPESRPLWWRLMSGVSRPAIAGEVVDVEPLKKETAYIFGLLSSSQQKALECWQ